jgi:UDP-glucose 4-epimerase
MNFLITGGAGSVGRDLTASLLWEGHRVRVLDRQAEPSASLQDPKPEWIEGSLEDARLVQEALRGVDTVIHLAWSFSDDPIELLQGDLKGHVVLLDACAAAKVSRLFYASTAVVYGKPVQTPITEEAPCLVEDARKPFYAVAKLRDMIGLAQSGRPLQVPDGAGGSFLDHDDLAHAIGLAIQTNGSIGQTFNLATLYLEWKEIARMILDVAGSSSSLEVIPAREWKGAPFLADPWELSTAKAELLFDYRSLFSPPAARQRIEGAIARCRKEINLKSSAS